MLGLCLWDQVGRRMSFWMCGVRSRNFPETGAREAGVIAQSTGVETLAMMQQSEKTGSPVPNIGYHRTTITPRTSDSSRGIRDVIKGYCVKNNLISIRRSGGSDHRCQAPPNCGGDRTVGAI